MVSKKAIEALLMGEDSDEIRALKKTQVNKILKEAENISIDIFGEFVDYQQMASPNLNTLIDELHEFVLTEL